MISNQIKQKIILIKHKLNKENKNDPILYSYYVKKLLDENNINSKIIKSNKHFFVLLDNKNIIDLSFELININIPFIIDKNISIVKNHLSNENFNKFEIKDSKIYDDIKIFKKEYNI